MIKKIQLYFLALALGTPTLTFAGFHFYVGGKPTNLLDVIGIFGILFSAIIPVIFGLAFIAFFWGVAKYIFNAADATKRKEGSAMMLYGIIALFVMLSIWGLVSLLGGTFGVNIGIPILPI